jgi:hypothetical protein
MEGIEKPHVDKYMEITNNWNYDASCTVTSLPVWDFENFKRLIFVVQSVHNFRYCFVVHPQLESNSACIRAHRLDYPVKFLKA